MIKFDVFPRDLGVGKNTKQVTITSHINVTTFENGSLTLCKVAMETTVHLNAGELEITKPVPEPIVVHNAPSSSVNGDNSYDYVPNVTGGVGPYEFELTGYDPLDGFEFNSSTGEFSRPPQ